MNKGTALVGYLLTFLAGMGLMYAIDHSGSGVEIGAEVASKGTGDSHASSPIPITDEDPAWGKPDAPVTATFTRRLPNLSSRAEYTGLSGRIGRGRKASGSART